MYFTVTLHCTSVWGNREAVGWTKNGRPKFDEFVCACVIWKHCPLFSQFINQIKKNRVALITSVFDLFCALAFPVTCLASSTHRQRLSSPKSRTWVKRRSCETPFIREILKRIVVLKEDVISCISGVRLDSKLAAILRTSRPTRTFLLYEVAQSQHAISKTGDIRNHDDGWSSRGVHRK